MKSVAEKILNCKNPDSVTDIINKCDINTKWDPLGGMENNYTVVHSQNSRPIPALMELIMNSYDAIALKNYKSKQPKVEPDNIQEAYEEIVDKSKENIELQADGTKKKDRKVINYKISDTGIGQSHDEFERKFLGAIEQGKHKRSYKFVQGKFGIGSKAVYPFLEGERYKFIASASYKDKNKWSWSLVRHNENEQKYEYLKNQENNEVPSFNGKIDNKNHGSIIKVFDYHQPFSKPSIISTGSRFKKKLERNIVKPPMKIKLSDKRHKDPDRNTKGLVNAVEESELHKDTVNIKNSFSDDRIGTLDIECYILKSDIELKEENNLEQATKTKKLLGGVQNKSAILYTLNGQTHAYEGKSPLMTKCGFSELSDDLIVVVETRNIDDTGLSDIFKSSRDEIIKRQIGKTLKTEIKECLKNDEELKSYENQRQVRKINQTDTKENIKESLEEIVKEDDDIYEIFQQGDTDIGGIKEKEKYKPNIKKKDPPDRFEFIDEYKPYENIFKTFDNKTQIDIECPVNKNKSVKFLLNAPDNYFSNGVGIIQVTPKNAHKKSKIKDGIFKFTIVPDDVEPGETKLLSVNISNTTRSFNLKKYVQISYTEAVESKTQTPSNKKGGIDLPDIEGVEKDNWENHGMDESTVIKMKPSDTISNMIIYINEDSKYQKSFIKQNDIENKSDVVRERFHRSVSLLSVLSMIRIKNNLDVEEQQVYDIVEESINGMSSGLIKQIISDKELKNW